MTGADGMGFEIVYCSDCQRRLGQKDFEQQKAFVVGVRTLCVSCAKPVLEAMSPAQRQAILSRTGSLTADRKPMPPAPAPRVPTRSVATQTQTKRRPKPRRPKWLLPAAVGAAVIVLAAFLLLVGRKDPPPTGKPPPPKDTPPEVVVAPPHEPEGGKPPATPDAPKRTFSPREASARKYLRQARELEQTNPSDVDGIARLCQNAVWEAKGTPAQKEAQQALEAAVARQQAALATELEAVGAEVRAAVEKGDFGRAIELLDAAAKRHDTPLWSVPLDRKRKEVHVASAAAATASTRPDTPDKPAPVPDKPAPPPVKRRDSERRKALSEQPPPGCRLACYLDCGPDTADGAEGEPVLRLAAGSAHTWTGADAAGVGPNATAAIEARNVVFEATGLAPAKAYLVGFSWWDGDAQRRAASVWASDGANGRKTRLLDTTRLPGRSRKPEEYVLPVPRGLYAGGRFRLTFRSDTRPSVAVGELWLWESAAPDADEAAIAASLGLGSRAPATVDIPPGPPVLQGVLSVDPARVSLVFNKPLDPASAARAASYAVTPGASVASAALEPGGRRVTLAVSPLAPGTLYTVAVSGVKDAEGNAIGAGAKRGFATLRLPRESLALWLRAEAPLDLDGDGYVRRWPDRSGRDNHAGQADAMRRPLWIEGALHGHPVVRFDGRDDVLESAKPAGKLEGFSLFVVIRPASLANHNQTIAARGGGGRFSFHASESGGVYVGTSTRSRIEPKDASGTGTMATGAWHQFAYVYGGGSGALYRNGRKLASRPIARPAPWGGFQLGTADRGTIHGDVAELLLYASALSGDDRRAVERYLHEKYFDPEAGVPPLASLTPEEMRLSPEMQRRHDAEVKRVLDAFAQELAGGKTDNERAVALLNLASAKVRDPRIAAKAIPFLTREGDATRGEAAVALAGYPGDKQVARALNTALGPNRTRPRVVEKLVASIVAVGHASSVPYLERVLRSGDPALGVAAAGALGHFRTKDAFEALLEVYGRLTAERQAAARRGGDAKKTVEERLKKFEPAIRGSLARLAGQKLAGWTDYRAWWKLNKADFVAGRPTTPIMPPSYDDPLAAVPEAKGYELVYDLDLERLGRDIAYGQDHSANAKPFDRVAYLVELQEDGGPMRYVWASMDAFTDDARKIGIPTAAVDVTFQQNVSNLAVFTNAPNVTAGQFPEGGNIEFWPNNYGKQNSAKVPDASDDQFDFGDKPSNPRDGYGSMQVHNHRVQETVFAINHWKQGDRADLGIGNSPKGNPDWTFTGGAGTYVYKRLRIFVRPRKP
jgi:hypothetical protein